MRILHQRGHGLTKQKLPEAERATLSIILDCDLVLMFLRSTYHTLLVETERRMALGKEVLSS